MLDTVRETPEAIELPQTFSFEISDPLHFQVFRRQLLNNIFASCVPLLFIFFTFSLIVQKVLIPTEFSDWRAFVATAAFLILLGVVWYAWAMYFQRKMRARKTADWQIWTVSSIGINVDSEFSVALFRWPIFEACRYHGDYWVLHVRSGYLILPTTSISPALLNFIRSQIRKLRRLSLACESCGYSLLKLAEARCPECGKTFAPELLPVLQSMASTRVE